MRTKIQYIFMLAATALLAGCMNEQEPFNTPSGEGTFALSLNKGEIVVNAETRAALSATDAANYNIMVYQNDYELWSQKKKYSALTGSDYILGVGTGYSVFAESCTEEEAETSNDGFGSKRFAGRSVAFAIEPSKQTEVTVNCTAANSGLCVVFDKSFTDEFGKYDVNTTDERHLTFNSENQAIFDTTTKKRTKGAVAYYNMPPTGELDVELEVVARGAKKVTKTVTLKTGKITRFTVYGPNAGTGDGTGGIDIVIGYDDDFDSEDHTIVID